eukprot:9987005-Alexandrium_andersonii.AAC.1
MAAIQPALCGLERFPRRPGDCRLARTPPRGPNSNPRGDSSNPGGKLDQCGQRLGEFERPHPRALPLSLIHI